MSSPEKAKAPEGTGADAQGNERQSEVSPRRGHREHRSGPGRVEYAQASLAMRDACERARVAKLNGQEWRVFSVVLDLTGTWSKLNDDVYTEAIAEKAAIHPKRTREILGRLHRLEVIGYTPGRGAGRPSRVWLRPARKAPGSDALSSPPRKAPRSGALSVEKAPGSDAEKAPGAGAPTEKAEKKISRSAAAAPEPDEFRTLLEPVGLHGQKRAEVMTVWEGEPERVGRCVAEYLRRGNARSPALLAKMVLDGDNPPAAGKADELKLAMRWAAESGRHFSDDEIAEHIATYFTGLTDAQRNDVENHAIFSRYNGR